MIATTLLALALLSGTPAPGAPPDGPKGAAPFPEGDEAPPDGTPHGQVLCGFDFRLLHGLSFYYILQEVRQEPGEPKPRVEVVYHAAVTFELSRGARVVRLAEPRGTFVLVHAPLGSIATTYRRFTSPRAAEVWARVLEEDAAAQGAEE